jgi:hypothetical protein
MSYPLCISYATTRPNTSHKISHYSSPYNVNLQTEQDQESQSEASDCRNTGSKRRCCAFLPAVAIFPSGVVCNTQIDDLHASHQRLRFGDETAITRVE